ncbi:MAG TPA: hypothetical protein VJG30_01170 [Candidatus Nanoarchaeia archaeon]|nr:hypothetical protein [Candidatus Nanoarchaeia archaeon]
MFVNKKKVAVLIVLIVVLGILFYINTPKKCARDYDCFSSNVVKCSKASVLSTKEDNLYFYEVLGKKQDNCIVKVRLMKLSETQSHDLRKALEGKSMSCSLPISLLESKDINSIDNLNDYCTGQLKEAILEVTLQKMYDVVVQNIGPIASQLRGVPASNITS